MSKKIQKNLHVEQNFFPLHTSWVNDFIFGNDPFISFSQPGNINYCTTPFYTKDTFIPSRKAPLPDAKLPASPFFKMSIEIDTEKVLDTVIGLPLDVLRAGVTVTQCGVAFAKPFLAGALLGDLLPKTIGEAIILAPIEKIIPIETYAIAAGTVIALDLASTGMDWVLNDTFLSDCSYFW